MGLLWLDVMYWSQFSEQHLDSAPRLTVVRVVKTSSGTTSETEQPQSSNPEGFDKAVSGI